MEKSNGPRKIDTPDGTFAAIERGRPGDPLALCLHGFPDHPRTFGPLLDALASAGFHAVAPWMRGYAPSVLDGPYHVDRLAGDILELAHVLSPERPVALVGHDWGAVATYAAAARAPARIVAAVSLAVPHPAAWLANLPRHPSQLLRSWYMGFFQLGRLADRLTAARDFALVFRLWRAWSPGWAPPEPERQELARCLAASWPAPVEYYRDNIRPRRMRALGATPISVPTLVLLGDADRGISTGVARGQERFFTGPFREEVLAGAGHFLHAERPGEVGGRVVEWLAARRS